MAPTPWRRRPLPRVVKPLIWLLLLGPLAKLIFLVVTDDLGANPAQAVIRYLGDWSIRLLCLVLAVTPLRWLLRWPALGSVRRLVGLFVFTYVSLHWLSYVWLDQAWVWRDVWSDIPKRPFILVGTLAWLLLLALSATSPRGVARRMGARRWQLLHRSVYVVAGLATIHFLWMRSGKNDFAEVWLYGGIMAALLIARLPALRRFYP
jgi:methionine sulfoxide reductase heme-binding subunit